MNPRNFFAELKRRNVYKVAVAYAVVAWLLIQAASILFPTFEAPAWVMKVFVSVVAFGFPIALVLAWAFELTPEGIRRTEEIAPDESIARRTGRKIGAHCDSWPSSLPPCSHFSFFGRKTCQPWRGKTPLQQRQAQSRRRASQSCHLPV